MTPATPAIEALARALEAEGWRVHLGEVYGAADLLALRAGSALVVARDGWRGEVRAAPMR